MRTWLPLLPVLTFGIGQSSEALVVSGMVDLGMQMQRERLQFRNRGSLASFTVDGKTSRFVASHYREHKRFQRFQHRDWGYCRDGMEAVRGGGGAGSSSTHDAESMDIDEALEKYGTFGRRSLVQYIIVSLLWTWEMLVIVAPVFVSPLKYEHASHSVVGTFQLGTAAAGWVGAVNSLFWGGVIAGVAVAGGFSDARGRRSAILVSATINTAFGVLSALAFAPWFYAATRFVAGIGIGFGMTNAYVLATELVVPKWRGRAGACLSWFSSLGLLLLALLAYCIPDWRALLGVVASLCATPLLFQGLILESPRWLLVQGRTREAEAVLAKILPDAPRLRLRLPATATAQAQLESGPGAGARSETLVDVARSRWLRGRLLGVLACWFAIGLVFYSFCFSVAYLPGSVHLNQALSAAAEIPLVPIQALLLALVGRRGCVALSALSCGLLSLLAFLHTLPALAPLLSLTPPSLLHAGLLLARLAAAMCFASLYLFSSELFPTSVRSSAMAAASLSSRLGSAASPLLIAAGTSASVAATAATGMPAVVLATSAGCMLCVAGVALLLPETSNATLAATISDAEAKISHRQRLANSSTTSTPARSSSQS